MRSIVALLVFVSLTVSSCAKSGHQSFDCPKAEVEAGLAAALDTYPDAVEVADGMDIYCEDDIPLTDFPCVTQWYGTDTRRGKMQAEHGLVAACIFHEAQHWQTVVLTDRTYDCYWHDDYCWVWYDYDQYLEDAEAEAGQTITDGSSLEQ